jgi:hypothetical protein
VKSDFAKDLTLAHSFDPTLPYAKLPLEEAKKLEKEMDYGKIKMMDPVTKKKA